jgi:hypothetical protein
LYNAYATSPPTPVEMAIKAINKWNDEYKLINSFDIIDSLPRNVNNIGHYTQLVKENACFVGCCAVRWVANSKTYQYWVIYY